MEPICIGRSLVAIGSESTCACTYGDLLSLHWSSTGSYLAGHIIYVENLAGHRITHHLSSTMIGAQVRKNYSHSGYLFQPSIFYFFSYFLRVGLDHFAGRIILPGGSFRWPDLALRPPIKNSGSRILVL